MRSDKQSSTARRSAGRLGARWGPAALVTAVIASGSFTLGSQAGAAEDLPDKSAAEILALIAEHDVAAFSGTVEQTSDLGIPQIPGEMGPHGAGGSSALELLTGSHTARIYVDGSQLRLQILDRLGERDLLVTDEAVWFYDSSANTATRLELPTDLPTDGLEAGSPPEGLPDELPEGLPFGPDGFPSGPDATPIDVAEAMIAAIESSTQVTVGADTAIAGRSAYSLVLTPLSVDTLVGSVSIAVDSETGMPLSVVVRARGQEKPAWSSTFTALSLDTPEPARFEFTPPPGATVEDPTSSAVEDPAPDDAEATGDTETDDVAARPAADPVVHGSGWDLVVGLPVGAGEAGLLADPTFSQLLTDVPGGRVLTTALLNVFVTDDGRMLVGSVTVDRLRAVAAE